MSQKKGVVIVNEEQVLVTRARGGDRLAFREIVERYKKKIYYLAYDLTNNHHDAEDLSQEVFIKAFRSINSFRGDSKFSSWLYRIAVNTSISKQRKKSYSAMQLEEDFENDKNPRNLNFHESSSQNPEKVAEAGVMQQHIRIALERLTSREKSIFILRHYNDLPFKEISHILKITIGSVKSMHFRAIKKLQKELSFYRQEFGLEGSYE